MCILFIQSGIFEKKQRSLIRKQLSQQVKKDRLEGQSLCILYYSGPSLMARIRRIMNFHK